MSHRFVCVHKFTFVTKFRNHIQSWNQFAHPITNEFWSNLLLLAILHSSIRCKLLFHSLTFQILPSDMLSLILHSFQQNEESFFVGLVCKKWNAVVKRNQNIHLGQVAQCYVKYGNMSALDLLNKMSAK